MKRAVVALVAIAAAAALLHVARTPIFDDRQLSSDIAASFVRQAMSAPCLAFHRDVGRFPTTDEGLTALIEKPAGLGELWRGPYLETKGDRLPLDPWLRGFGYRCPGLHNPQSYDLWSLGPDGIESADDIGNWQ